MFAVAPEPGSKCPCSLSAHAAMMEISGGFAVSISESENFIQWERFPADIYLKQGGHSHGRKC